MSRSISPGLSVVALVVAAAGSASAVEQAVLPVPPRQEVSTLTSVTEAVLADAATRTGVDRASLTVESVEPVTWANGSLGCPQPGMSYTMALVPGYRIKVRAAAQLLDYHASERGHFVLCPPGLSEKPAGEERI